MLKTLKVKNFRNLGISQLEFRPGFTILIGENGQGKTNILEAIYFLSYGKSFRGAVATAINWHENEARILGKADNVDIEIIVRRDQENKFLINSKPKNLSALLGRFTSVAFHPQEIELVFGPPALRRAWLDRLIATTDKNYLYELINYQKALRNRNKLLKTGGFQTTEMEVWDQSLAAHGTKIWQTRERTVSVLVQLLKGLARPLVGKLVVLVYKNPILGKEGPAAESLYLKILASQRDVERRFQVTLFGPHRDDFKIIAEEERGPNIVQKDLAVFGSRAEQRQAAALLKLSEAKLFARVFGKAPTILLDDIASELDSKNRELLLGHLSASQIIITTTSLDPLPAVVRNKARVLVVKDGDVAAG